MVASHELLMYRLNKYKVVDPNGWYLITPFISISYFATNEWRKRAGGRFIICLKIYKDKLLTVQ